MDTIYKDIRRFQNKCNDCIDDRSASSARALQKEVQRLEDEAQVGKNPKSLENRVKSVMSKLDQVGKAGAMSHGDVSALENQCESFIQKLRRL